MTDYKASKRITGTNAERIGLSTNPDTLGTSANGTNTGVTLDTTNEKLGSGCYSFDANLDYTRMDAGATTFTDKGTIALWIKATNNVSARTAISSKADASTNPQIMVRGTDTDQFEMVIAGIAETIPPAVTEGTWYHVAITWDQTANVCKSYSCCPLVSDIEPLFNDTSPPTLTASPYCLDKKKALPKCPLPGSILPVLIAPVTLVFVSEPY